MPTANALKSNKDPALDSNLLRSTQESEKLRRNAVVVFNRRTAELRRSAVKLSNKNSQTSLSAREVWPLIEDTNSIIGQAKHFFKQAVKFNAEGNLTNALKDYISALEAKYNALIALCVRRVQAENILSESIAAFANNASKDRPIPFINGSNRPQGRGNFVNFTAPRAPTTRKSSNSLAGLRQSIASLNAPNRNRPNTARNVAPPSSGGRLTMSTNSGNIAQNNSYNNRISAAAERAKTTLARRQYQRDGEFQEWQQDFWSNFERKLFDKLDDLKKISKANGDSGSGIGGILGGVLAGGLASKVGKWIKGIGGNILNFVKKGRLAIAAGAGGILGAIMNGGEGITKFFDDAEKTLSAKWTGLTDWFNKKFGEFNGMWNSSTAALDDTLKRWQGTLSTVYDDVIKRISTFIDDAGTILGKVKDKISEGLEPIKDVLSRAGSTVGEFIDDIGNRLSKIPDNIRQLIPGAVSAIEEWSESIGAKITSLKGSISSGLSGAVDEFVKFTTSVADHAKTIGSSISNIADVAGKHVGSALENVDSLITKLSSAAQAAAGVAASSVSMSGVGNAAKIASASPAVPTTGSTTTTATVHPTEAPIAKPGIMSRAAEGLASIPGVRAAGQVIGGAAKIAGAGAGVPLEAGLGAIFTETNMGMTPGSASLGDRGVGAGASVLTAIPSLAVDAFEALTPNKFAPGTMQRMLMSEYDRTFRSEDNDRANILAHRLMAGNPVSDKELGSSIPFINLVRRNVMNLVDLQSKRATGWADNQKVDPSALPGDLSSAMRNPRSREFLGNKSNQATFADVNLKIGSSVASAIDSYAESLSKGSPLSNVKASIPSEANMLAEEIKAFIAATPAPAPVDLSGLRGAKLNLTQATSWEQLTSTQSSPNQKRDAVEWMLANNVAPADPNNPAYVETLGRLKASNKMIFEALSRSPDLEARSKGGIVVGGGSGVGAVGVTANGAAFSMSEKGSEAIMPLVDGPQGLGVRSYQTNTTGDGAISIQPESMSLVMDANAAKALGTSIGDAIIEGGGIKSSDYSFAPPFTPSAPSATATPRPNASNVAIPNTGVPVPARPPVSNTGVPSSGNAHSNNNTSYGSNNAVVRNPGVPIPTAVSATGKIGANQYPASGAAVASSGALGALSSKYESRGNAGAIGHDGTGGYSYGTYQIATQTGTMNKFLNHLQQTNPEMAAKLQAAGGSQGALAGSEQFRNTWKEMATTPEFAKAQHDYIKSTHYDPVARSLQKDGMDLSTRSKALQDVVWSTGVQHGGNTSVVNRALSKLGKPASEVTDEELIPAIYQERRGGFPSLQVKDPKAWNSVQNRMTNENKDALSMLKNERANPTNTTVAQTTPTSATPANTVMAQASPSLNDAILSSGGAVNIMMADSTPVTSATPAASPVKTASVPNPNTPTSPRNAATIPSLITELQKTTDPARRLELQQQIMGSMQAGAPMRPPEATHTPSGEQKFIPGTKIPMEPDFNSIQLAEAQHRTVNDLAGYQGGNYGIRGITQPQGFIPKGFLPNLSLDNPSWGTGLTSLGGALTGKTNASPMATPTETKSPTFDMPFLSQAGDMVSSMGDKMSSLIGQVTRPLESMLNIPAANSRPMTESAGSTRMPYVPPAMAQTAPAQEPAAPAAAPNSAQAPMAGTAPPTITSIPMMLEDFGMMLINVADFA